MGLSITIKPQVQNNKINYEQMWYISESSPVDPYGLVEIFKNQGVFSIIKLSVGQL